VFTSELRGNIREADLIERSFSVEICLRSRCLATVCVNTPQYVTLSRVQLFGSLGVLSELNEIIIVFAMEYMNKEIKSIGIVTCMDMTAHGVWIVNRIY
jgi:hypothetical protein